MHAALVRIWSDVVRMPAELPLIAVAVLIAATASALIDLTLLLILLATFRIEPASPSIEVALPLMLFALVKIEPALPLM